MVETNKYASDYIEDLDRAQAALLNADNIDEGPVFTARTSTGLDLKINTYLCAEDGEMKCVVLSRAKEQIVGARVNKIFHQHGEMMSEGKINIGLRNQGIAFPMEIAFIRALEYASMQIDQPITWYAMSGTDVDMPSDSPMMLRWNNLYGRDGLLELAYKPIPDPHGMSQKTIYDMVVTAEPGGEPYTPKALEGRVFQLSADTEQADRIENVQAEIRTTLLANQD